MATIETVESKVVKKRVATLYRVSGKGQLVQDDIPSQRRTCMEFISRQPGWIHVEEYIEKGVSGFRKKAEKRDVIQQVKRDAESGRFDVLLVFMFDRLGRIEDETPFILKWFCKQGVEMWSTQEGQQKFEDHTDDLINYIRFWQSSGESKKTSMRVKENFIQLAEDGLFAGGKAGYGYKLVPSGVLNKKGKELMKRVIEPESALIVDEIYRLADELGYGGKRIATYFNEERDPRVVSPTGKEWTAGVINFILRNPLYNGYPTSNKRTSDMGVFNMQKPEDWVKSKKQIPELVIIDDERWNRVQDGRKARAPHKLHGSKVEVVVSTENGEEYTQLVIPGSKSIANTRSPLLLVGMIFCGHCGAPLTTTYNRKKYKLADGTEQIWKAPKYRCSGKAQGKPCKGKTIHSHNIVEPAVLQEINIYLDQLKEVDFATQINNIRKKSLSGNLKEVSHAKDDFERTKKELMVLTNEVPKAIMGESAFAPELLNSLMEQKKEELAALEARLKDLERVLAQKQIEIREIELLSKYIPVWRDVFKKAPHEKKKMMLSTIIDNVIVTRDEITINVKLHITQFCSTIDGSANDSLGRAHRWQR